MGDLGPALLLGAVLVARLFVAPATDTAAWGQPGPLGLAVLLGSAIVVTALLTLRRRRPLPVLLAVTAACVLWIVAGYPGPGAVAPVVLALYTVAHQSPPARSAIATALAILPVGVATWWLIDAGGEPGQAITSALVLALGAVVGVAARFRERSLLDRASAIAREAESREMRIRGDLAEERLRLARDLHDTIGHQLAIVAVQSAAADRLIERDRVRARESLAVVRQASQTVMTELAGALDLLRGGPQVPQAAPGLPDITELVDGARAAGVGATLEVVGTPDRTGPGSDGARAGLAVAHRMVQEALTNVQRHAPGASARVGLQVEPDGMLVRVVNDAPTTPPRRPSEGDAGDVAPGTGRGLAGMLERVRAVGGTLDTGPNETGGFTVEAWIPWEAPDA